MNRVMNVAVVIGAITLVLGLTACGDKAADAPAATPTTIATPTPAPSTPSAPAEAATEPAQPMPKAKDAAQALANLEQAMTRPGHVYHASLAEVNTGAINDPETVTPVWSAEAWVDLEQQRSRSDFQFDPNFVDPMPFAAPELPPPPRSIIHVADQTYRLYNTQVWLSVDEPCLGLDRPLLAVAFICDLSVNSWSRGGAFTANEFDGALFLKQDVDFNGRLALSLSLGEHAMSYLYLDAVTYLPLGWTINMMESGTRVTTITSDFVARESFDAALLDPASLGVTEGPAPAGRLLVQRDLRAENANPEIFVINLDGTGELNLSNDPGREVGAVWSPDGQKIAFSSDRNGINGAHEIYVVNADGSDLTNVTNTPTGEGMPVWSPDGTRIAFHSDRNGNRFSELYVMDADGTNVVQLTGLDAINDQAWSMDSGQIALASEAGLHVVNADGTGEVLLVPIAGARSPQWTPDGSRIVFVSSAYPNSDIYVVNSDGSGLTNLTNSPDQDNMPVLSPDGTRIVFTSDRLNPGATRDAFVMNIDGSQAAPLTDPAKLTTCETGCSWSPDGAYVVAVMPDPTGWSPQIVIVRADGSFAMELPGGIGLSPDWSP